MARKEKAPKLLHKKWRLWVIAVLAVVGISSALSGCERKETGNPTSSAVQSSEPSGEENPGEETSGSSGSGKMEGAGDLGDYHVEIKGASLVKDYQDKPAIMVTYAWTNNSDDTTNAMVAVRPTAFQDGVELETAILLGVEGYDADAFMKDIRPGATLDVQAAFLLTSETSVVELEISELISFSDDVVTMNFDPASLS